MSRVLRVLFCCRLAGVLQWQLLPLTTALLEEAMLREAPSLSASSPPSKETLGDIYNIMSIVELQVRRKHREYEPSDSVGFAGSACHEQPKKSAAGT